MARLTKDQIRPGLYMVGGTPQDKSFDAIIARANDALDVLAEIKKAKAEREVKDKAEWEKLIHWCY